jgi:outer membrane receptor protein involved in Fe transport
LKKSPASRPQRPLFAVTGLAFVVSSILAATARAAENPAEPSGLEEIIVTAQKRTENLQDVPISLQVLDSRKLDELRVSSFEDYAKFLPSLSSQNLGPGQQKLFIRGVTNGTDGLRVGSQPTVAVYLDEQPVTTIANNLDVHIYDIARVEQLSGPQGTLFGASAMSGALRLITNKPSTRAFEAGYDLDGNVTSAGSPGGRAEGFVNIPVSERAAIRLVGFTEHDGGYINNVLGPPETYPTSGVVRSNVGLVQSHFNDVTTSGGRAALKIDLDQSWTVTPTVMLQHQTADGVPGFEPALGDLNVARYFPDTSVDRWWQAALTVEGKISDLDFVYSGSYMDRDVDTSSDYSAYSYNYDVYYAATPQYFGNLFRNDAGDLISPAMRLLSHNRFTKSSHELRLSSPSDGRLRFVAGAFLQQQQNDTRNEFRVDGLATIYSITGQPGVQYLNAMTRIDRDRAVFGEVSYDLGSKLTLTGGLRVFGYDNTVYGFSGYNGQPQYGGLDPRPSGEQLCEPDSAAIAGPGRPCINVDQRATDTGSTHKLTLTYHVDAERMLYATWSTGFRPGGINRTKDAEPYQPDYLTNLETGWKTSWLANRLRFNGALFLARWKDPQYTICATNCVYVVINAGAAEIYGLEMDAQWAASDSLTLSGSATWLDAKLTTDACRYGYSGSTCRNAEGVADPTVPPVARAGTPLPASRFKGNLIARYTFDVGDLAAHLQVAGVAQSEVFTTPITTPGYASLDLTAGVGHRGWSTELYVRNALDRRGEQSRFDLCAGLGTCMEMVVLPIAPRTVGLTFSQRF